ncbi:hypothetical protein HPB50_010412 [Hyalomma asiaticum]|uniref:Uncharacterized protein n=1 Tax=Hyalomma asiaticum TaxID=266040 RepID=A0ACB7RY40_HYAAI|nr:hypothetical protein HPB50_010412 [Hyalomma asiaticum]
MGELLLAEDGTVAALALWRWLLLLLLLLLGDDHSTQPLLLLSESLLRLRRRCEKKSIRGLGKEGFRERFSYENGARVQTAAAEIESLSPTLGISLGLPSLVEGGQKRGRRPSTGIQGAAAL